MTLRDELIADWRRFGDVGCLSTLLAAVPPELPSAIVRRERDRRLRIVAEPLVTRLSVYRAAALIAELGNATERNRPPRLGAVAEMPELAADIAAARREIARMLPWLPVRANGKRWPTQRHLIRLLSA